MRKTALKLTALSASILAFSILTANAASSSYFTILPPVNNNPIFTNSNSGKPIYLYNKDNTKIGVGGELEAGIEKYEGDRTKLQNDGTQINVEASNLINKKYDLSVIFYSEIDFADTKGVNTGVTVNSSDGWDNPSLSQVFGGFSSKYGILTFGAQNTTGDWSDPTLYTYEFGGIDPLNSFASQSIVYQSPRINGFSLVTNYNFGQSDQNVNGNDNDNNTNSDTNGYAFMLQYNANINKEVTFEAQGAYGRLYNASLQPGQTEPSVGPVLEYGATGAPIKNSNGAGYGTQQAAIGSVQATYNNFTLGVSYSWLKAQEGNSVNLNVTNKAGQSQYANGLLNSSFGAINANGFQNKVIGVQIGGKYQYSKSGNSIYFDYDIVRTTALNTDSELNPGDQRSQVATLGTSYFLDPQAVVFLEGAIWYNKNSNYIKGVSGLSHRYKALELGIQYTF